jgi:hypothetical protein
MEIYRGLTGNRSITRNAFKQFAKSYLDTITIIDEQLKAKRAEYKSAINEIDKSRIKQEFDNIWITQWPHYTDSEPYPQPDGTEPYPPLKVMKIFSRKQRIFIAKTALSARIGVKDRRRFQHFNHIIDAMAGPRYLQLIIKKCIHPPTYPYNDLDEVSVNDNSEDFGLMEPDGRRTRHRTHHRTRRRIYGQARTPSPVQEIAPAYYTPGNTPLRDPSPYRTPPPGYQTPGPHVSLGHNQDNRTVGGRNTFSNTFWKKVGKNTSKKVGKKHNLLRNTFSKKVGKNSTRTRRRRRI